MILLDSNVVLDIVTADPVWAIWSKETIARAQVQNRLAINDVVYAEMSIRFLDITDVDTFVSEMSLDLERMPKAALFLAGKVYQRYRAAGGTRTGVLPDFFIGAHAATLQVPLITRDPRRYRSYFPTLMLVAPYITT